MNSASDSTTDLETADSAPQPSGAGPSRLFTVVGLMAGIVLAWVGWALYVQMTTLSVPDVPNATPEVIADFVGSEGGFARLPTVEQERFLIAVFKRYREPAQHAELARTIGRMSHAQKETFMDATATLLHTRIMEAVHEYQQLAPDKRDAFIDVTMQQFAQLQLSLASAQPDGHSRQMFADLLPEDTTAWQKLFISKFSPKDQADLDEFLKAIARRQP